MKRKLKEISPEAIKRISSSDKMFIRIFDQSLVLHSLEYSREPEIITRFGLKSGKYLEEIMNNCFELTNYPVKPEDIN
jgi:hypothetical protein